MAIQRDFVLNRGLVVNTSATVAGVDILANDYTTYTTLTANIYDTYAYLAANIASGGSTNTAIVYANDYATYLAALSNDYTSYTTLVSEYRANDYSTLLTALANDGVTLASARANDWATYTTLANEYAANDYTSYSTLLSGYSANDYTTWSGLNSAINIKANSSVNILAGDGIAGGGPLTGNVSIEVDSTVVRTSGDQSIGGTKTFTNSVLVSGDLTVSGNVVSVDSTSLRIEDRFIELGSNNTGAPIGDVGIYLNRGTSGNSAIYYSEAGGYFGLAHTADPATNTVVSPTAFGTLRIDTLILANNGVVTNLNADLLDSQSGAYYVDFVNATNTNLITLARVTANGASTTDAITVGGLTVDSNTLHVDSTNNFVGVRTLTPASPLQIEDVGLDTSVLVTSATTPDQVVDSFSASIFRTAKYLVQVHDTVNNHYQSSEILLTHDGVNTYSTEYAIVYSVGSLATFSSDISGGTVRLLCTPTNAVNTIRVYRSVLNG